MTALTPNEYLDARRPEWLDAEVCGRVVYDRAMRMVRVTDAVIEAALRGVHGR